MLESNEQEASAISLLQFKNVTKRFGNSVAVNDVSFNVCSHSVVALLGENGAGKSTLIKTLAGIYQADHGEIIYKGVALDQKNRQHNEIAFIHQDLGLVDWMTVSENMALAMGYQRKFGFIDWKATDAQAAEALASVNADIDPRTRVFRLTRAEQSLIAIARAVYCNAKILVLDEPTASLPAADVERLFEVIRDLRRKEKEWG
jgi:ribose transport system ATP-binding protein